MPIRMIGLDTMSILTIPYDWNNFAPIENNSKRLTYRSLWIVLNCGQSIFSRRATSEKSKFYGNLKYFEIVKPVFKVIKCLFTPSPLSLFMRPAGQLSSYLDLVVKKFRWFDQATQSAVLQTVQRALKTRRTAILAKPIAAMNGVSGKLLSIHSLIRLINYTLNY